jgi:hypothetical protein
VVDCRVAGSEKEGPGPLATAVLSPGGQLTVLVLNVTAERARASFEISGGPPSPLHVYQVEEGTLGFSFRMEPLRALASGKPAELTLPARSVTVLTTFERAHRDDGVTVEKSAEQDAP